MLRLPLSLISAIGGMVLTVGSAYALPASSGAAGSGISQKAPARLGGLMSIPALRNAKLQKDINLSDEQKQKIDELAQESGREVGEATKGLDKEASLKKRRAMFPQIEEKERKGVTDILKPQQVQRLKQIELQGMGVNAFQKPEVVRTVGLSLEQQEKITALFKQAEKERKASAEAGGGFSIKEFGALQNKQALMAKALKLLTPAQQQKFDKLLGKRFEW